MGNKEDMKAELTKLLNKKAEPIRKKRQEPLPATDLTEEKRPGRQSRPENRMVKEIRTSLVINRNLYQVINQIAIMNNLTIKEVMNAAMKLYIDRYEQKNGPITSRESKISADELI